MAPRHCGRECNNLNLNLNLNLQEGCPVILLGNMSSGLANGTRLIVVKLMDRVMEVEVATGPNKGERVFLSRLSITPFDT